MKIEVKYIFIYLYTSNHVVARTLLLFESTSTNVPNCAMLFYSTGPVKEGWFFFFRLQIENGENLVIRMGREI